MRKELPMLFSTPMVQAIIDGRKTQTRRIIKPQPKLGNGGIVAVDDFKDGCWATRTQISSDPVHYEITQLYEPKYRKGQILYVRESWNITDPDGDTPIFLRYVYKASSPGVSPVHGKAIWRPSIHMPKEAARIWLEVTNVRVERLHDITEEDAIAEGVEKIAEYGQSGYKNYLKPDSSPTDIDAVLSFETLWHSINGAKSWDDNPWVWVIEFKVLTTTGML